MSFLVLVLAVWIEKFSALRHRIQRDGGWLRELAKLESSASLGKQPWLILTLLVLLPVALLALLLLVLESAAWSGSRPLFALRGDRLGSGRWSAVVRGGV